MTTFQQEAYESLKIVLENPATFQTVVDTVFSHLDVDCNRFLDVKELESFISTVCESMGIQDAPNREQVTHVFKHLDLDNDKRVTKDELAVFLQHLFREQLKHAEETMKKHH